MQRNGSHTQAQQLVDQACRFPVLLGGAWENARQPRALAAKRLSP